MTTVTIAQQMKQSNWTKASLWIAQIFLWLTLFCLPFSHFLVNQFVSLTAIFVLISGDYHAKWLRLKQYRSILWIVIFVIMVGVSITYSSATLPKAFSFFNKYTKLLYIIPFLYICQSAKRRQISLDILLLGIVIATILSFLYKIHLADYSFTERWPKIFAIPGTEGLFINLIHFSVLEAFALYLLLIRIFQNRLRSMSIALFVLIAFHLFYLNTERTGCLAAVVLTYLVILQYGFKKKLKGIIALIVVTVLSAIIVLTSSGFLLKLKAFSREFKNYAVVAPSVTSKNKSTVYIGEALGSVGLRLEFTKGSLTIIKNHPWFGTGVGSFAKEYNRIGGALIPETTELWDPHNAFLMIGVQMGLVGLIIFGIFLLMLLYDIHRLPFYEKCIGYAIGILFLLNSLFNATLIDNTVGFLYVIIASILLSSLPYPKKSNGDSAS